jgi:hypothetical protein
MPGVGGPRLCFYDSKVLWWRQCDATWTVLPQSLSVEMWTLQMKVLPGYGQAATMAPMGVVPLLGGVAECASIFLALFEHVVMLGRQ